MSETYIISYPKCGRTWLRLMLGRVFSLHFGLSDVNLLELEEMSSLQSDIPRLIFTHDGPANLKTAVELLSQDKQFYAGKRVILLVRDPADVVVSYYFEYTRRRSVFNPPQFNEFEGDLPDFLRHDRGGLDTILAFYQNWADHRHLPASFLLVRYEDMVAHTAHELRRVLDFLPLAPVKDDIIDSAVAYGRFDNMRLLEKQNALDSERLQPGNPDDPESYKTRRGQIGGYTDYLQPADIAYVWERRQQLSPFYGYTHD